MTLHQGTVECELTTRLVLFDFDCTLTIRDTIWPFTTFLLKQNQRGYTVRLAALCLSGLLKFHVIPNEYFKRGLAALLVRGRSAQEMDLVAERFHDAYLEKILNQTAVQSLAEHIAHGDEIYIVSSNFDFFLKPLQKKWNLAGIIATRTEVLNGVFTGRIVGNACHGKEKVARVIECFGLTKIKEAVAYGDSASDTFLLDSVKDGYWVKPSDELLEPRHHSRTGSDRSSSR
jgi:phosphatidylglycerophosphatase C